MAKPAMAIRGLFLCPEVKAMPIIALQNRISEHARFIYVFLDIKYCIGPVNRKVLKKCIIS
jgi:hypothetical protein